MIPPLFSSSHSFIHSFIHLFPLLLQFLQEIGDIDLETEVRRWNRIGKGGCLAARGEGISEGGGGQSQLAIIDGGKNEEGWERI